MCSHDRATAVDSLPVFGYYAQGDSIILHVLPH